MREKKYTLPRHTNLAKQGSRTGAFFVDLALLLALTLAFFYGCFNLIFNKVTKSYAEYVDKEEIYSGLYYKDDKGENQIITHGSIEDYVGTLEYYYLCYLSGDQSKVKEGFEPSKDRHETYDVAWFNKNILEIDETSETSYFVYQKSDEEVDDSKIGVKNPNVDESVVLEFVARQYSKGALFDFNDLESIAEANSKLAFFATLGVVLAIFTSGIIIYIVMPIILKNGQSVGKKVFKLGLADSDGYKMSNKALIMRYMPFTVIDFSLILLYLINLYVALTVIIIVFLVSFALAMSSPKKMSLHDYVSRTIVIDFVGSVIFDNPIDEEAYILKEDNLLEENAPHEAGEEPELRYEK